MDSIESVAGDCPAINPDERGTFAQQLSIRSAPTPMKEAIKFDIPACRDFFPFASLPAELRHQIWGDALATPGMHFLRIQSEDSSSFASWWAKGTVSLPSDSDDEEEDRLLFETRNEVAPTETHRAALVPQYPTPQADISYYTTLNQELTKFTVTCNESASVIKRLMARPSTLTLENGRMISLDMHSDIVYLEYVPPVVFEDSLRFVRDLECAGLEKIRNVAVRFCHKWHREQSPPLCPICGLTHPQPDRFAYPSHLYQFIARYLPNLKRFYFVDYFILRKSAEDEAQECPSKVECTSTRKAAGRSYSLRPPFLVADSSIGKALLRKFEGGNRTYYEVDQKEWSVKSNVFETLSWVQDCFVQYANVSKLATHKKPQDVKFGVLACEWSVGRPSETKKAPVTPVKKGHNKRAFCGEHATRRNRRSPVVTSVREASPFEAGAGYPFVFGDTGRNDFEFTFEMARR